MGSRKKKNAPFQIRQERGAGTPYVVRFSRFGKQHKRSTGETEHEAAFKRAGEIYFAFVESAPSKGDGLATLDAGMRWVRSLSHAGIADLVRPSGLVVAWCSRWSTVDLITTESVARYVHERLSEVSRATVKRDISPLRRFIHWCQMEGLIDHGVVVETPQRYESGVVARKRKSPSERYYTPEQIERFLSAVPEETQKGLPARGFFTFMWDTGLRRGTLYALEAPRHYQNGSGTLLITEDIDKERYGRRIPLSPRARAVLDAICPPDHVGPIFGKRDLRKAMLAASEAAGISPPIGFHDFRHSASTRMAMGTKNLAGVAALLGHRNVSTTARYTHPTEAAAIAALADLQAGLVTPS